MSRSPAHLSPRRAARLLPQGFRHDSVVPVLVLAGLLAVPAAATARWLVLACVAAMAPVALLLQWATGTDNAARAGRPVHPAARLLARAVMLLSIAAAATVCVLAIVDPQLLGITGGPR